MSFNGYTTTPYGRDCELCPRVQTIFHEYKVRPEDVAVLQEEGLVSVKQMRFADPDGNDDERSLFDVAVLQRIPCPLQRIVITEAFRQVIKASSVNNRGGFDGPSYESIDLTEDDRLGSDVAPSEAPFKYDVTHTSMMTTETKTAATTATTEAITTTAAPTKTRTRGRPKGKCKRHKPWSNDKRNKKTDDGKSKVATRKIVKTAKKYIPKDKTTTKTKTTKTKTTTKTASLMEPNAESMIERMFDLISGLLRQNRLTNRAELVKDYVHSRLILELKDLAGFDCGGRQLETSLENEENDVVVKEDGDGLFGDVEAAGDVVGGDTGVVEVPNDGADHEIKTETLNLSATQRANARRIFQAPRFPSSASLKKRATTTRYPCDKCNSSFVSPIRLHCHKASQHGRFRCYYCGFKFATEESLKKHKNEVHQKPERKFICAECGHVTGVLKRYIDHVLKHPSKPLFACFCGKSFARRDQITTHFKTSHVKHDSEGDETTSKQPPQKVLIHCPLCEYQLSNQTTLDNHMRNRHIGDFAFQCRLCPARYHSWSNLRKHRDRKHPEEPMYRCGPCGFSCNRAIAYRQHLRSSGHVAIVPTRPDAEPMILGVEVPERKSTFACPFCVDVDVDVVVDIGKEFEVVGSLQKHRQRHHRDKRIYVCQPCFYTTGDVDAYRKHRELIAHLEKIGKPPSGGPFGFESQEC